MSTGKIVQVVGPVVDVEFYDGLPGIYNALTVEYRIQDEPVNVTLEVQQHLGDKLVRAISMSGTEGLKRGFDVVDSGGPIHMPVGDGVMGRMFNVTEIQSTSADRFKRINIIRSIVFLHRWLTNPYHHRSSLPASKSST